ncbi:MAG: hypothetical protein KC503_27260, partial [Myxococcales bacterium]|nr:hypothetical protein [Myxococcales bacterium]
MALPDGIHNYLEEVRRRRRLVHLFGDSAMFVAASATALLLVVLMSGWLDRWRVSLRMGGAALLGVALLAFIVRLIVRLRRLRDPGHLAELVGAARPKLRSDLLSTVELSLQEGPTRFSAQLLGALASSTENALRRAAPATLVPARQMRPGAVALAATLIAWAAAATLAPSFLGKAAAGLFRVAGAAPDRVAAQPLLGDIVLRYVYPPHIGRIPRVVESSTGHISAPAGTRVELRTTALAPLRTATLVLERAATRDGDGDTGG